jgi:hypothetical protein
LPLYSADDFQYRSADPDGLGGIPMFTFKWLAVPSLCAALAVAPASMVLADSGTHKKKAHRTAVHKPQKASTKKVAEASMTAAKPAAPKAAVKAHSATKDTKKKIATMSSTKSTKTAKGKTNTNKHKPHKHA